MQYYVIYFYTPALRKKTTSPAPIDHPNAEACQTTTFRIGCEATADLGHFLSCTWTENFKVAKQTKRDKQSFLVVGVS